ncbi:hypothetical protein OS175_04940 [Marinicella sp. S1101]|uniref:hypothetical protein n=1 Tax=Marinicella marina TaxID=2996016 RepID=UPI002260C3B2|nr:hypothetical protein [Marinicella marina]MCX7553213.1 hypothetical protein [Marinicella marina]MDJ1138945.1 hypothetical protein [Marinicella marina]
MRIIKRTFFYLTAMLLTLLLFTVVINTSPFDQALLPEVQAIRDQKSEPFQENNAYLAMWAFGHGLDQPFTQTVEALRQQLNQEINNQGIDYPQQALSQRYRAPEGSDRIWREQYIQCNSREQINCMQRLIAQLAEQEVTDLRLLELMRRYETMVEFDVFQEAIQFDWDAPMLAYAPILITKRIYLARAYVQQRNAALMETLLKDLRFWRMVLRDSHSMITKMVVVSTIRDTLFTLAEGIRNERFEQPELAHLQQQLMNLSAQEMDMTNTFIHEFKFILSVLDRPESAVPEEWLSWFSLYQPQATVNTHHRYFLQPAKALAQMSSAEIHQFYADGQGQFESPVSWSSTMLYNPTGKELVSYGLPVYKDYLARVHDLNGMVLLLKLQLELALNPELDPQQVVNESVHRNPYTGEAMIYDAAAKRLFFECFDPHSVCEINL